MLDLITHQNQRKPLARLQSLGQRRVFLDDPIRYVQVRHADVFAVIFTQVAVDVADCLLQRQRGTSTTGMTCIGRPGPQDDHLLALDLIHGHLHQARRA